MTERASHSGWDEAIAHLENARQVTAFTGAGISAESGIPTFRDKQGGFWGRFSAEELASPEGFRRDKALVWGWYTWRRKMLMLAEPNTGHLALATLASRYEAFTLITQNVDNLHERAGSHPVIHLHGQLNQNRCFACNAPQGFLKDDLDEINGVDLAQAARGAPPKIMPSTCLQCGGDLRPDVTWFGECLPESAWAAAEGAVREADVILCIGTSGIVYPAARLPETGRNAGATVIQINPNETALDDVAHINLRGSASEILPAIVLALSGTLG